MGRLGRFLRENFSKATIFWIICALAITFVGYKARLTQFDIFPPIGDTHDEMKGAFNGISLIREGIPKSWSWFDEYKTFTMKTIAGDSYRIVEPWFDEPPLFGLMEGGYAIYKGMDTVEKVRVGVLRYPMVKIASFNILMLFTIIWILRGPLEASIGSLIFAVEPTIVMSSRMPISDNMLVTWSLASLLLILIYLRTKNKWVLLVTSLLAASSVLIKSTGIFIPAALIFILFYEKKYRGVVVQIASLALFMVLWVWYGYYYNWELFVKIFQVASGRELFMPGMIISVFTAFRIGEKPMDFDPQLIWGWVSVIAYSIFNSKNGKQTLAKLVLPLFIGSYLVFFAIMSGHIKGWYRFPFYPYISWASGAFFLYILSNPRFLLTLFFLGIPVSSSYITAANGDRWGAPQIKIYQTLFPLIMGIPLLYELTNHPWAKKASQLLLILAFGGYIFWSLRTVFFFQDHFWYS